MFKQLALRLTIQIITPTYKRVQYGYLGKLSSITLALSVAFVPSATNGLRPSQSQVVVTSNPSSTVYTVYTVFC